MDVTLGCIYGFAILIAWLSFRATLRWKSRQYLVSATPSRPGARLYALIFNPLRRSMGIRPLRVIPYIDAAHRNQIEFLERADRLAREIRAALKHSPIAVERKATLERQAREIPDNLVKALWTLARLRRIAESIDPRYDPQGHARQDLTDMRDSIVSEMTHAIEVLSPIPVSLMKVELGRGDGAFDRLVSGLDETHKRLIDLSASYLEIKEWSHYGS